MPDELAGAGTAVADAGTSGGGAGTETPPSGEPVVTETPAGIPEGTPGGEGPPEGAPGEGEIAEGEEPAPEGEGEEPAPDEDFDGRNIDDRARKALAKLKKIDPVVAKELANTYHRTQRIIKDTGSKTLSEAVNKVAANVAVIESLGGHEGIQNLQSEVNDYRTEITQFAEGDPALPAQLYEANPDGLVNSVSASIDLLAEKDVERFKTAVRPAIVARMKQAGFTPTIQQIAKHILDGQGQEAYDLLQKMANWVGNEEQLQQKSVQTKAERNPEREKLDIERREFETQKAQAYDQRVGVDVNNLNNESMKAIVEPFFKEIKLTDPKGRRKFIQAVQSDVWEAMRLDKTWQMQAHAIKNKGDARETAEFLNQKFAELLPVHFRLNRNALYPAYKPAAKKVVPITKPANGAPTNGAPAPPKKPAAAAPAPAGVIRLAAGQRPAHNDVDWHKTDDLDWIRGYATLTNGKRVQFDKDAPANRV
jgi:hypothetical protein